MRSDISFDSADGHSTIVGHMWRDEGVEPWCLLQISHGMCEYARRYDDFAQYLAGRGVVVYGSDHLGHGGSVPDAEHLGYFGGAGSRSHLLEDLHTVNRMARQAHPGLPMVLLGHSMGSFFARRYAVLWPHSIDGLMLSGTGGPNALAGFGIAAARREMQRNGAMSRPKRLHVLAFGSYLARIPDAKTPFDWISRDPEVAREYAANPLNNFRFTAAGFHELFSILKDVSGRDWAKGIARDMPVYLFSGAEDPVGDYGKGVQRVYQWLRQAGVQDVQMKLYPGARHEMLNELNRAEAYADALEWLVFHWGGQTATKG